MRPVVTVSVTSGSVASSRIEIARFSGSVRSGTSVSVGTRLTFVTVHWNVCVVCVEPSEAPITTAYEPALVYDSVPLMSPVAGFRETPTGSGAAL